MPIPVDAPPPIRLRAINAQFCSQAKRPKAGNCPLVRSGGATALTWQGGCAEHCPAPLPLQARGVVTPAAAPGTVPGAESRHPPPPPSHSLRLRRPQAAFSARSSPPFLQLLLNQTGEVTDIQKQVRCRLPAPPFVPSHQQPRSGCCPLKLDILNLSEGATLEHRLEPHSGEPCSGGKTGPPLLQGYRSCLGPRSWWCWEVPLSSRLWLGFLDTGAWPCLPCKAIG